MTTFPKIIGLAGQMGSGKDTAAAYLVDIYKYTRVAFADGVREEVTEDLRRCSDGIPLEEVYAKPTTPRMRAILQRWGTEYRRAQDTDYWVKYASQKMKALQDQAKGAAAFAVSDVRFPNEAAMIREQGGVVWLIAG